MPEVAVGKAERQKVKAILMGTHVAEAICTISAHARGRAALCTAGAIPALLSALQACNALAPGERLVGLVESACWTLRAFSRDPDAAYTRALSAAGHAAVL